ncbi:MAG: lysoplasmalogenase [Proteobacteria bacterium]|nr:lysoplasmalogenase [Pseudomonadota bacterium]
MIAVVATITCVLATAALVLAEWRISRGLAADRLRTLAKATASGSFIGVGIAAWSGSSYGAWIVVGLVLGAIGDLALLGRSSRAFLAGLVAFLGGHLAYVVAITTIAPIATWSSPVAILPIVAAAFALRWLWPHLGTFRGPVIVYVATITAMVIGALASHRPILAAGAIVFFASDLMVAREKFVEPSFANKALGLPAYFAGQLCIAWSMLGS